MSSDQSFRQPTSIALRCRGRVMISATFTKSMYTALDESLIKSIKRCDKGGQQAERNTAWRIELRRRGILCGNYCVTTKDQRLSNATQAGFWVVGNGSGNGNGRQGMKSSRLMHSICHASDTEPLKIPYTSVVSNFETAHRTNHPNPPANI